MQDLPSRSVKSGSNSMGKSAAKSNNDPDSNGIAVDQEQDAFQNRQDLTRLLIQELYDLGYQRTARSLEDESGLMLVTPLVTDFQDAILDGNWNSAEEFIHEIPFRDPQKLSEAVALIKEQKILEALEDRNYSEALIILRTEAAPLLQDDSERLQGLLNLVLSPDSEISLKVKKDRPYNSSRERMLEILSEYFSPKTVIPKHRLRALLEQAKKYQIFKAPYHNVSKPLSLFTDYVADRSEFPIYPTIQCKGHEDEVWYAAFSHNGKYLATCGRETYIIIWDVSQGKNIQMLKGHTSRIAFLEWSDNDEKILSCCHDKFARVWDVKTGKCEGAYNAHKEYISSGAWLSETEFITGGLDQQLIFWDVNGDIKYRHTGFRVSDLALTPDKKRLILIDLDSRFAVMDIATKEFLCRKSFEQQLHCARVSKDSESVLLNFSTQEIQLWDLKDYKLVRKFSGHKQSEFVIRCCFGGKDENFVLSGSEDKSIYVWQCETGILLEKLNAHSSIVNCVVYNPVDPFMFASVGDDCKVILWTTQPPDDYSEGSSRALLEF